MKKIIAQRSQHPNHDKSSDDMKRKPESIWMFVERLPYLEQYVKWFQDQAARQHVLSLTDKQKLCGQAVGLLQHCGTYKLQCCIILKLIMWYFKSVLKL